MKHEEVKNKPLFNLGEDNPYGDYFIGQSYLALLAQSPDDSTSVGNVTFEPGCRNNWHVHLDGYQILLVTGGEGLYQEEGKTARILKAGDVVVTEKGVKHWHGATNDAWFSHIAITAGSSEFYESVSNKEYEEANIKHS
ncbi:MULTISPECIES: cupin domain-containing protein [unclassified Staphylococcus]|uniref:cupin domain-containing protein n=1 Tax=unclassified Staphylococcus TaxID=91994 RepID=UPI0021D28465|nr:MULTISPECIES: cupin domain-containing protein [unclassified Staphylococcus]UXR77536.1 cupin domain-containing protein [Staphylococcus sp. IVB6227]UXR83322.1 cupin domain-containing protein [Staphylococcus sp. IVB6214]